MSETKLIIFDLDGVLIESKEAHHKSLNKALIETDYEPIFDSERPKFEAIPTREKLDRLGITGKDALKIRELKAKYFQEDFVDTIQPNQKLRAVIEKCKNNGFKIAVASNAIRATVYAILSQLHIMDLMDIVVSNEDVKQPKPHPEMYWKCMSELNILPTETVIFEDSPIGLEGANKSGAVCVYEVQGPEALIISLRQMLFLIEDYLKPKPKRNIVIPMAGAGSRFKSAGFELPKPLIEVAGKKMIEWVLDNLKDVEGQRIFIVQEDSFDLYSTVLTQLSPGCIIKSVSGLTKGAVMSVLAAEKLIDNDIPLLIVNSDQYIQDDFSWETVLAYFDDFAGGIITFSVFNGDPRWSYVRRSDTFGYEHLIMQVAEKLAISQEATTGIYSFTKGSDFVKFAKQMIEKNLTFNNEFYIAPVFNQGIQVGKEYVTYRVGGFNGLGDPVSVVNFLNKLIKEKENVD